MAFGFRCYYLEFILLVDMVELKVVRSIRFRVRFFAGRWWSWGIRFLRFFYFYMVICSYCGERSSRFKDGRGGGG